MAMRIFLAALMALGIAGFGGVLWMSAAPSRHEAAQAAPVRVTVLTMNQALPAGSLLKPGDLTSREIDQADMPPGGNPDSAEIRRGLNGAMLRRSVGVGDMVLSGDVTRPGDHGFLAAVLQPGTRAVTVGVDAISGSAGLIWPGDRVDVILTQTLEGKDIPLSRRVSAETVLHDIRVIAIDQRLVQGAAPGGPESQTARTVTLEVTEAQAARVTIATRIGHLSLSVRAATKLAVNTPTAVEQSSLIWAGDVSHALPEVGASAEVPKVMRVFPGAQDGKEYKF